MALVLLGLVGLCPVFQGFTRFFRDVIMWIREMKGLLSSETQPRDVASAEELIANHFECRVGVFLKNHDQLIIREGDLTVSLSY